MRKTILILLFALCSSNAVFSQQPSRELQKKQLIAQEANHYAKLQYAKSQQTDNQANYDVLYYDINLEVILSPEMLVGQVGIQAEVVHQAINELQVNLLDNMVVDSVKIGDQIATFDHSNDLLTINLQETHDPGEKARSRIYYHGNPEQTGFGAFGFDTYAGEPMIWSLSEPFGARNWWPCKDIPSDKADSVDIRVTVPKDLTVVSNGTLRSETIHGSKKTYWWHEQYPIVTYLVSVAIYPYSTFSDSLEVVSGRKMPIDYYVFPDRMGDAKLKYAKTKFMIQAFSLLFGPYPFHEEKYGHAQFLGGANMEHQTISSLLIDAPEYTVAHELAHQWWGDLITCRNFSHIWLNEGFATYSEALWAEWFYGKEAYWEEVNGNKYFGDGTIFVQQMDVGTIFNYNLSYRKASWVLHMLRHVVGDQVFFQILRAYTSDPRFRYGTAVTEEFQQLCENISGKNLDDFFHQWIYEEYYPKYVFSYETKDSSGLYVTSVNIQQEQTNTVVFHMPIDLHFEFDFSDTTIVADNYLADQTYRFVFEEKPILVEMDPEGWILKELREEIQRPKFAKGILLVNGVDWLTYNNEIRSAFEDRAFYGDFPISFWDCFSEPPSGYPSTVPEPIGRGKVPLKILGEYSTVIWLGNHYNGDLTYWKNTNIMEYLNAGGNVMLITPKGQDFINTDLRDYLGIIWQEDAYNTISSCVSAYSGLTHMDFIGYQSDNSVFSVNFTQSETVLLFRDPGGFSVPRGLGAWRKPVGGGTYREDGGQFIFISGRAYRYDHTDLRENVSFILTNMFEESKSDIASQSTSPVAFKLFRSYPNPFQENTIIHLNVSKPDQFSIQIFNLLGQRVKVLHQGKLETGEYRFTWNGKGTDQQPLSPGIYFCRIDHPDFRKSIKIIKLQ